MAYKRWNRLEQMGYTECVDSGYAETKDIYNKIKAEQAVKGNKVLRVKTDTKGLINYVVLAQKDISK